MRPIKYVLSVGAVGVAAVAIAACGGSSTASKPAAATASASAQAHSQPAASTLQSVTLRIKSDSEHGKRGPDGKWHDAYLPANFTVHVGQEVRVTVLNYDDASHSFTAPSLGVNQLIKGGSAGAPSTVSFTFKTPSKAGSYQWLCAMPCDPWAMAHTGYMRGDVTVVS